MARPSIHSMRHKIVFCSARDEVESGTLFVAKDIIFSTFAGIEPRLSSMFSKRGSAIFEEKNRSTHIITIRYRPSLNLTSAAWMYEQFIKSAPRWYKLIGEMELTSDMKYLRIEANLAERGDNIMEPARVNSFSPRIPKVSGL